MDDKEKNRIMRRFMEVIPNPECPMCHGHQFGVVDSYLVNPVTEDYRKPHALVRRSIPTVAIVCAKCGFISQHSMAALRLLNNNDSSASLENRTEEIGDSNLKV